MVEIVVLMVKAMAVIFLADFITGLVHWLEDSYWSIETPILGKWLIEANLAHHKNGQAFLQKTWLESSWDLLLIGTIIVTVAAFFHCLTWELCLFALIIANANQIHKWAHVTRYENKPKLVGMLQKMYILQRTQHHGQHHRKPNNTHFCIVTNWLNPILDKLKFWRGLEYIVGKSKTA